ncbi:MULTISPECIES: TetR/AcrR family transcriptional regulator [Comamonas]|uniref:TetR/AcrR family transcriptional regulator n=1 Tax=Comamonas TaxID=283 RepID=UPI00140287DF|nr:MULTISPECIES: TetR/AcrR family transcriptional regulator [Comamonas]
MQLQPTDTNAGDAKNQIQEYKDTLIINAAAELFYKRGFKSATLDEIAASIGVTKPFIYKRFKSKHELLERLFDKVFAGLYEAVSQCEQLEDKDPVRRFEFFIDTYTRRKIELSTFSVILLEEEKSLSPEKISDIRSKYHGFDALVTRLIVNGVEAGVFQVGNPKVTAFAISGMVQWTHRWYQPNGKLSIEALCQEMTQMALRLVGWTGQYVLPVPPIAQR